MTAAKTMHIALVGWVGCFWSPCCVWFFTNFTCGGKLLQLIFPNIEIENCRVLAPFALMATPQTHHERVELMLLLSVLVLCCCSVVLVLWQDGWMDAALCVYELWLQLFTFFFPTNSYAAHKNAIRFLCSCIIITHSMMLLPALHSTYVLNFCLFNFKLEMLV